MYIINLRETRTNLLVTNRFHWLCGSFHVPFLPEKIKIGQGLYMGPFAEVLILILYFVNHDIWCVKEEKLMTLDRMQKPGINI